MKSQIAWAAAVSLSLASLAGARADVIYDDNFATDTPNSAPPGWFRANTTGSFSIPVSTDAVSGNATNQRAADITTSTTSARTVMFNFANPTNPAASSPVSLNDGDSIKLTVLIRATSVTDGNRTLRFGLLNDEGTHVTADGNSANNNNNAAALGDDTGYFFRIDTGNAVAGDKSIDYDIGKTTNGTISSLNSDTTGVRTLDDGSTINDSVQHTLILTLTRSGNSIKGSASVDGKIVNGIDDGTIGASPTAAVTSFNSVWINHQSSISYFIDDLKVETVAVPEPASVASLTLFSAALLHRRRRNVLKPISSLLT